MCQECWRRVPRALFTPQGLRRLLPPRGPTLSLFARFSPPQNIRVWDMQDYICLQSFCGKLFALGNCPITSIYFHKSENSLICSTYSVSAVQEGASPAPRHGSQEGLH